MLKHVNFLFSTIRFILNTTPTQFVNSKTSNAIKYIDGLYTNYVNVSLQKNGTHKITLIFTNKSLPETIQWKHRLKNNLRTLNCLILSSKKDSDFSKMSQIRDEIFTCDNINELPDIIVMCTNQPRINDCIKLIRYIHRCNLSEIGINNFVFNVMFDEADKSENLTYICNFINQLNEYIIIKENEIDKKIIESIIFITATAFDKFWVKLKKVGITELENIKKSIIEEFEPFEKIIENYHKISDNNIIDISDDKDPVEVVRNVLKKINGRRIVYAPAGFKVKSHDSMKELFIHYGYDVLVINGSNKSFYINKQQILIEDFNKKHNVKGELRDTLRKYNKLYPNNSLGITGHLCIERGITFNTDGFNFTDSVFSYCHSKNMASLIQFLGRSTGHSDYVDKHNIWIPNEIKLKVDEYLNLLIEIQKNNPDTFTEEDFKIKNKDRNNPAYTVPILISNIDNDTWNKFKKKQTKPNSKCTNFNKKFVEEFIMNYFNQNGIDYDLDNYKKEQYTMPEPDNIKSYNKHIVGIKNAAINKKEYSLFAKKIKNNGENKYKNLYQVWFDKKEKCIIVSFYNGEKLKESESNSKSITI